jgi:cell division protein ZapA (FtsZ GTPase activity inhibitor)
MKASAEIKLCGQKIVVKSSDSDPELNKEVIELVAERITAAESRFKATKTPHQVVLLALLDLAEEYVRAKRRVSDYRSEIEERSERVASLLGGK